jgi:hypothetical protein
MTTPIHLNIEDTDGKEIYSIENISLSFIPRIGETFDLVVTDYGHYENFLDEVKTKGKLRVADVGNVYMEHNKSQSIIITLAFSSDKRFNGQ